MEVYDKNKIGKLFAWGGEHLVYNYDTGKVIKFSALFFLLGKNAKEKAFSDYKICKKFFGDYILNTDLYLSKNGKTIVQIQEKIQGHYLDKKDFKNKFIAIQYQDIIKGYFLLVESGNFEIDLIGRDGMWKRCLSNIFVTEGEKLVIIDATLLGLSKKCGMKWYIKALRNIVLFRQNSTIRIFDKIIKNNFGV